MSAERFNGGIFPPANSFFYILAEVCMKKILLLLLLALSVSFAENLTIQGKLTEIPGKMPPNDLYNYVYILKYKVTKVLEGKFAGKEILVGVYNPLTPRGASADKMAKLFQGDVRAFKAGDSHVLKLLPLEGNYSGAVEDEYFDDESERYLAVEVLKAK